ncbi:MAG: YdcF family protein [Rhodospirillum sp.]|nr:YdcF family protein [Rhodospirillum sp.]MCF8491789.1 YdcF family protein [Rhodospirillum sp.]MCF8503100.1 YdcF family protein [Rhodospirillum sp.]
MLTAIVVLGARRAPDGSPSRAMRRRVAKAVVQARGFPGIPVVFSGGPTRGTVSEAQVMAHLAQAEGLGRERIVLEERARNTLENARECIPLLLERGIRRILLVTDAPHMPRSLMCFRLLGGASLTVLPRPASWPGPLQTLVMAGREVAALLSYLPRLRGERARMSLMDRSGNPDP